MSKVIIIALGLCTLFVTGVFGEIIQSPLNAAMAVGDQMVFNCSSSSTGAITWIYTTNCNSGVGTTLTDGNCDIISSHTSHYRTEKPGGFVCNLVVFDALLAHGGCYICADGLGLGRLLSAFLIVVDSNSNITTNTTDLISGEYVMISNSISYSGPSLLPPPLPPLFYWTPQSDPNNNITSYPGLTTTNSTSSYIVVEAQKPDVLPFVCNLFFNTPVNVPQACANNTPTYRTSWITPTYKVSYAPENVQVSGQPDPCLNEPVELICSASGHPTPTCKWHNSTSGIILSESCTIKIEVEGDYQCIASNTIRNTIYNASSAVVSIIDCKRMSEDRYTIRIGSLGVLDISDEGHGSDLG